MSSVDTLGAEAPAVKPRPLGLWMCVALVVGNMIGSGVFLLPSALAAFGPIAIIGWILTSAGALVLALIFGRLARTTTVSGGPYAYTREGFGDFAGFLIGWGYWIAIWSGNAAVAVAFAGYVGFLVPHIAQNSNAGLLTALAAIWILTWVNIRGVSEAGMVQLVTTVMKTVPLILIAILGVSFIEPANYVPANISGQSSAAAIAACAALTLWAFIGLESATVPAAEVSQPEKTIPRATIIGTLLAAFVYIAVTIVAFGVIPSADLKNSSAPLAEIAHVMWGRYGGIFVAIAACISTFGTLNGFTLLTGQVPYSAAKDKLFPRSFGKLSKAGTPAFALIVSNALASGLIIMNYSKGLVDQFVFLTLLATTATLIPYLFCALAEIMIIAKSGKPIANQKVALVFTLGAVGFAYSAWAIYGAGHETVFYGFFLLVTGVPVYVLLKWRNRSPNSKNETIQGA